MGSAVALRLARSGCAVSVWNRTPNKAEPIVAAGATELASPLDLERCDVVMTALTDGAAVSELLIGCGLAQALRPGSLLVDLSSIRPNEAQAHAALLAARGVRYLDAPLSGGPAGAEAGELAIMVGGDPKALRLAEPLLRLLGRVTLVGGPGAGQVAKLANQLMVAANIAGVAEALTLARRGGADPAAVRDALRGGFAESRVLEVHGARMLAGDFAPGGRSSLHLKDLDNAARLLAEEGSSLPLLDLLRELFESLCAKGGADLDHSALFLAPTEIDHAPSCSSK
jgi:2-hydroxy-3-oxopropionate reductase